MIEKQLVAKFQKKVKASLPDCFVYKIPDTKGLGGMRPMDLILIFKGTPYAIEAKVKNRKLTKYQDYSLKKAQRAGAISLMITEKTNLNELMDYFLTNAKASPNKPFQEKT